MAKAETKYFISFNGLRETLSKKNIPNNLFLIVKEKVLQDEIVRLIRETLKISDKAVCFNAEDRIIENLINECSSMGLFAEKKIVVLRNVKKLLKHEKVSLLNYLRNSNPDVCLVMLASDDETVPSKIFLYDAKENAESAVMNKKIVEAGVKIFRIEEFTESEAMNWVREQFDGYKISNDLIVHFMQYTDNSLDEILSEIEKLKTFCIDSKEITIESVNLCNGMNRDFNEMDFIRAVMERNKEAALNIYNRISLKRDVEVFLVFLLNSAFVIVSKLFDPSTAKLNGWDLQRGLKLWGDDQQRLLPFYRNYSRKSSPDKIRLAFSQIYNADKSLKTSSADKQSVFASLINSLCSL